MFERMRFAISTFALAILAAGAAHGATFGQPSPWEMNFQPAATPIMEFIETFHFWILVIITLIMIFVTILLLYVMVRFNAKSNPKPSKVTHNTLLEVAWTVVPV